MSLSMPKSSLGCEELGKPPCTGLNCRSSASEKLADAALMAKNIQDPGLIKGSTTICTYWSRCDLSHLHYSWQALQGRLLGDWTKAKEAEKDSGSRCLV